MKIEEIYMARCLQLARLASANVSPNPMVGAVVVHEGRIIGEGYHRRCGEPHAEVNAIASVKNQELLTESTLYVSLEPCSHYGKTPPCSQLIIDKRIPRVVVGCLDPFPAVSGRGVRMLRQVGVEVHVGLLEKECRALNRSFMTAHEAERPYILLKWAESRDGFMDVLRSGEGVAARLSTPTSSVLVHRLRTLYDAILVGSFTARLDNPSLTARLWRGKSPLRLVIDRELQLPPHLHLFTDGNPTWVFTAKERAPQGAVTYHTLNFEENILPQMLHLLHQARVERLLVEGGAALLKSFIAANLWDEARREIGQITLGSGVAAPTLKGEVTEVVSCEGNRIVHYRPYGNTPKEG